MVAEGLEKLISTASILISLSPLVTFVLCFSVATVSDGCMAKKASRRQPLPLVSSSMLVHERFPFTEL